MNANPSFTFDYRIFLFGLPFLFLALQAVRLGRRENRPASWILLGIFGLGFCLSAWLYLFPTDTSGLTAIGLTRMSIMVASLLALVEYGRRLLLQPGKFTLGVGIYIPLMLLASVGIIKGFNGLESSCLYVLGISGGGLVAIAIKRSAQSHRVNENLSLHSATLVLAILAVVGYAVIDFHKDNATSNTSTALAELVVSNDAINPDAKSEKSEIVQFAGDTQQAEASDRNADEGKTRTLDEIMAERRRASMTFFKTGFLVLLCLIGMYQCRYITMRAIQRRRAVKDGEGMIG